MTNNFYREFEKLQVMYNEMKKMRGLGDEMGRLEQIQRELDYARYKHFSSMASNPSNNRWIRTGSNPY